MTTPADDQYGGHMGTTSLVCRRCGALVYPSPEARQLHTEFHDQLGHLAEYVAELREQSDRQAEYDAEMRERSGE